MPIDNGLYETLGMGWWDENEAINTLQSWINPGRFGYFREVLEQLQIDPQGKETLDVGCGGGLLAEEFARLGCRVIGIDPSESSLATARMHAQQEGLEIEYRQGFGEGLQLGDAHFEIVYCSDVLEHVQDLNAVIGEIARVLKPGGVFLFDTINRTVMSKLITIKVLQEWEATRVMPPNLHDWKMFIKPGELLAVMQKHGLVTREMTGLGQKANPLTMLWLLYKRKRGEVTLKEVGARMGMRKSRDKSNMYMGYAIKASGGAPG